MPQQNQSWHRRNWEALAAGLYLLASILSGWKWFLFHNEDRAIDAVISFFLAVVFTFGYRAHRTTLRYEEAMKKVRQEHPFPWESDIKASK
jgi:hypothetical protein